MVTFAVALTVVAVLIAALAPSLHAGRGDPQQVLRENASQAAAPGYRGLGRRVLVVTQVASALLLLTGAGLLAKDILKMARFDPGFDTHNLLEAWMPFPPDRYSDDESRHVLVAGLRARLAAIPGVRSACAMASQDNSFTISATEGGITLEGRVSA